MIIIREDTPEKLSGISSLFISFDFNMAVIEVLKTCEKYNYNKDKKEWEIPVTSLAYLLDELVFVDDITLKLKKEVKKDTYYKLTLSHAYPPFKHQEEAILYGLEHPCFLLLDQPGLGKSNSAIYLAEELHAQKGLEHCLIVCGVNTLKANWKREIQKFSTLSCRILGERISKKGKITYSSVKERAAELMSPIAEFFIIMNIECLRNSDIIQALRTTKNKIDMVVVDEAHKISSSSQQGQNMIKMSKYKYKLALTGTLILNNPLSAYGALKWIGIEHANLTNFKSQYCVYGGFGGHQIVGYKNLNILKEEIESCSLRRLKDEVRDLPPKTIINEIVEMDDIHRKFYDDVKQGVKEECNKIVLNANNTLALTTRLRQATACPSILTTNNIISSKVSRAIDLVEEICATGEKVVIMSVFKETLNVLEKELKQYNPLCGNGDIPDAIVAKNIALFQEDPTYKVFLGTTAKCGTGITLNAASYLICIDTPWTYALQEQVEDRIDRITNKKSATIYRLICQDSVDEIVEQIIETKQAVSDFIVDDKADAQAMKILQTYIQDL